MRIAPAVAAPFLVVALSGSAALARPRAPGVAAQLDLAAAKSSLVTIEKDLRKKVPTTWLYLELAATHLAYEGDLEGLRALVDGLDPKLPARGFVLRARALLGERAEVDTIAAAIDKDTPHLGKEGPAAACTIALAYEALGETAIADARLLEAHADCPSFVAEEDLEAGRTKRAREILERDASKPPAGVYLAVMRARLLGRAKAPGATAAISAAAAMVVKEGNDVAETLADLARVQAEAGAKREARALFAQALGQYDPTEEGGFGRAAVLGQLIDAAIAIGDKKAAIKLATGAYGALANDARPDELLDAAVAWAKVGDAKKAGAHLKRALDAAHGDAHELDAVVLVHAYASTGQLDLAIRTAVGANDISRVEALLAVADFARAHEVVATKAIRDALASM